MPAGVEIILGANFDDAQAAMNAFNQSVGKFVNQMAGLFAAAGANVEGFQKSLRTLIDAQKGLNVAIAGTNTGVAQTTTVINNIRGATRGLAGDFGVLSYTMTRTIHGFAELFVRPGQALLILSNDIPQLVTRFRELAVEQKALAAAGQPALSAMGLLAKAFDPLTFAIQIGLTALLRYGPELFRWATGMDKAAESAKKLKEEQKELDSAFSSGADETFKQISKVEQLTRVINSSTSADGAKKQAYNELIALYPQLESEVNKQIEQQKAIMEKYPQFLQYYDEHAEKAKILTSKINELTDALYKQAIAEGLGSQIKKMSEDTGKLIIKQDDLKKAADASGEAAKKALAPYRDLIKLAKENPTNQRLQDAVTRLYQGQVGDVVGQAEKDKAALDENTKAIKAKREETQKFIIKQNEYTNAVEKSILAQKGYKGQLEQTLKTEQSRLNHMAPTDKGFEDQRKKVEAARDALKAYDTTPLKGHSTTTKATKTQVDDLTKATDQYHAAIEAANRGWMEGRSSYSQMLNNELSAIDKFIVQVEGMHLPEEETILGKIWDDRRAVEAAINRQNLGAAMNAELAKQQRQLEKYMAKTYPIGKKAKLVTNYQDPEASTKRRNAVDALEKAGIDPTKYVNFSDPVEKQADEASEAMKRLRREFKEFANGIGSMVSKPFEDMVGAIFEGKNAMDTLVDSVKNLFEELTKAVVKAGLLSLIGKKDQVNAMGGFGGILGSLLGLGIPFMADGGIVTSPTLAMIGEAGPEKVIPLSKSSQYEGGNLNVNVRGRIRGKDIDLSGNNYNRWKDR